VDLMNNFEIDAPSPVDLSQERPMSFYPSVFAAIYNPVLATGEMAGLGRMRSEVLAEAKGAVLEIGAGTGLNLRHYPAGVNLTVTEPDAAMFRRLTKAAVDHPLRPALVQAPAENLPFEAGRFDTVVSTLVLCTVPDVPASLAEIRRVLKPGGRLLLIEHVLGGRALAAVQNRMHRPWKAFACGCNCNLRTPELLTDAGFDAGSLRPASWKLMPPLVRPLVHGSIEAPI
jgi:SAM-dependent methyltransferase